MVVNPQISVVMAVYNGEPYIKDTIESILNQTYEDFEFLIVDDCSSDDTISIIKSYEDPRINLIINEKNLGQTPSLNKGIDLAKGFYIARMDADDIAHAERLQKQYMFLEKYKEIVLLGTSYRILGTSTVKKLDFSQAELKVRLFLGLNSFAHPTVMFRKSLFSHDNFSYNEKNPVNQDFELWARISKTYKLANLEEVLLDYRVHENQISTKRFNEQQTHVKRIITTTLKEYYKDLSSDDITNHFKLLGFEKMILSDLDDVVAWANSLREKNKEIKHFDIATFDGYIKRFKNKRISQVFNTTYILASKYSPKLYFEFLKARTRYSPKLSHVTVFKFMVKCLLFQTKIESKG